MLGSKSQKLFKKEHTRLGKSRRYIVGREEKAIYDTKRPPLVEKKSKAQIELWQISTLETSEMAFGQEKRNKIVSAIK